MTSGQQTFEALGDRLRAILSSDPSRAAFVELCTITQQAAEHSLARTAGELVPMARATVEKWPERVRAAPLLWINRLVEGVLPVEALELCAALSLTAALHPRLHAAAGNRKLLAWLAALPPQAPALAGISVGSTHAVRRQLNQEEEREPDRRFHRKEVHPRTDDRSIALKAFLDSGEAPDYTPLFRSPLTRVVRVLDFSIDTVQRDFYQATQDELVIQDLCVLEVLSLVPSSVVEVLDLYGQTFRSEWQLGKASYIELRGWGTAPKQTRLTALNLSGGHPIGDETVLQLKELCPFLRELSMVPGGALTIFSEGVSDDGEWSSQRGNWCLDGDVDQMLVTRRGVAALSELRGPLRLEVADHRQYEDAPKNRYEDELRAALGSIRDGIEITTPSAELTKLGRWSNYFDP